MIRADPAEHNFVDETPAGPNGVLDYGEDVKNYTVLDSESFKGKDNELGTADDVPGLNRYQKDCLKAMANPLRLKILHALEEGELAVGHLAESIDSSQTNVSKQLTILRGAGLVDSRREGVSVFYRISDPMVFEICHAVCDSLLDRANLEVETIAKGRTQMLPASPE